MYFIKILIITIFFGREAAVIFHIVGIITTAKRGGFFVPIRKTAHPSRADGQTKNTK